MARLKDENWNLNNGTLKVDGSRAYPIETIQAALLMDLRDELRRLNDLLHCQNFIEIPATLRSIRRKLPTPARKAK